MDGAPGSTGETVSLFAENFANVIIFFLFLSSDLPIPPPLTLFLFFAISALSFVLLSPCKGAPGRKGQPGDDGTPGRDVSR